MYWDSLRTPPPPPHWVPLPAAPGSSAAAVSLETRCPRPRPFGGRQLTQRKVRVSSSGLTAPKPDYSKHGNIRLRPYQALNRQELQYCKIVIRNSGKECKLVNFRTICLTARSVGGYINPVWNRQKLPFPPACFCVQALAQIGYFESCERSARLHPVPQC